MNKIIDEISELTSKHRIIPFLGAGCSALHLKCDWNSITQEMRKIVNSTRTKNIEVAQEYVDVFGRSDFCNFLKKHLQIEHFNDEDGYSDIIIMSLGLKLIYTTNQDNVLEKCFEKYGRTYKTIVTIDDFKEYVPGDNLLIKFHGDLSNDDSIVFTKKDYQKRMNKSNYFLDIRLRSDLLGKRLFFIGYSFNDDNIKELFEEINSVFSSNMPSSYLLPFTYSDELNEECKKYGIKVINTQELFPDFLQADAYEKFLSELSRKTFEKKQGVEVKNLFHPKIPNTLQVISKAEINNLRDSCESLDVESFIKKYRGLLDRTMVPKDFEEDVLEIFCDMCERCTEYQFYDLVGICFNSFITNPLYQIEMLAQTISIYNKVKNVNKFPISRPSFHQMNKSYYSLCLARSIDIVKNKGVKISESFREAIMFWTRDTKLDNYTIECKNYIYMNYNFLFSKEKEFQNPYKNSHNYLIHEGSFRDMFDKLAPLRFTSPLED